MALLSKFVNHRPSQLGNPVASNIKDPQVRSIIHNIQTVLQSRRTLANAQKIGLADYSEQLVSEALMHQLCGDMTEQIAFHEPRLSNVQVSLVENGSNNWSMQIKGEINGRTQTPTFESSSDNRIAFVFELAKSGYLNQLNEVQVVML